MDGLVFFRMPEIKKPYSAPQVTKTLYCIVTQPTDPSQVKPDLNTYSPKELAAKENVSTTNVYSWIEQGLPVMRRGKMGNILIHYQDYIQWMIDCAYKEKNVRDIPSWAFRFVKSATPKTVKKTPEMPKKKKAVSRFFTASLSFLPMLDRFSKKTKCSKKW